MKLPRIYTYKISFPDQGWWYWGVHKEAKYGEFYMGSPVTHKAKWDFFYHEKQILEFFDTWDEAREVEKRLIKPDLNNPLCLNEHAGGNLSQQSCSKGGLLGSQQCKEKQKGWFNPDLQREKALLTVERGVGIHTFESRSRGGKAGGPRAAITQAKLQKGFFDPKVQSAGGKKSVEMGVGIHSPEQKKLAKERLAMTNKIKWRCLVTGKISTAGPLTLWQNARGIDTSLRELVL